MEEGYQYEIRIEGYLSDRWADWFEGLSIHNEASGTTTLSGWFVDQAALFGALTQIHALNLTLISLQRSSVKAAATEGHPAADQKHDGHQGD